MSTLCSCTSYVSIKYGALCIPEMLENFVLCSYLWVLFLCVFFFFPQKMHTIKHSLLVPMFA